MTQRNWPLALVLLDGTVLATSTHEIGAALEKRGLHVVTDADLAVLDAMADEGMLPDGYLRAVALDYAKHAWEIVARAELARREALKDSE